MMTFGRDQLEIGDMPLYWRIRKPGMPAHPTIPATLPLKLGLDPQLGLVRQEIDDRLRAVLHDIYLAESNIGYLQEGHTLSKGYGEDLLRFIERSIATRGTRRALEIGCGGCLILSALAARGLDVAGIDPSPIASEAGRAKGLEVIASFFPPETPVAPADLIFHSDVLEHVEDPVAFLRAHHPYLRDAGCIAIAVPDSTQSVALGDLSLLMHQHLSYFTEGSLRRVVEAAGFSVLGIEKSGYGGSLYCLAMRANGAATAADGQGDGGFFERARVAAANVRRRIERAREPGFYMPLRSAPYLAAFDAIRPGTRVFDDTSHWHRGQIDGLPLPIENLGDFAASPPASAFVMSLTFGEVVRGKIQGVAPQVEVATLVELLAS
jgi:SAM-dependent methyltransferase